jgi:hypothetical protein
MALLETLLGGASSLYGLFAAADQERRARRAQEAALNQMAVQNDQMYQDQLGQAHHSLLQMAGLGGDAIMAQGRGLGDAYAAAGLYNPSAVAGGLNLAQHDQQSQLANLAAQLQASAQAQRQQGALDIGRLRFGNAQGAYGNAQNELGLARGGLTSFLGNLVQTNLAQSGANLGRTAVPAMNGTQNQGANLPGVAPAYKLPGLGDYGAGTTAQSALGSLQGYQQPSYGLAMPPRKRNPYQMAGIGY